MISAVLEEVKPVGVLATLLVFALAYINFGMTPVLVSDHWDAIARAPGLPDIVSVPGLVVTFGAIAWVFAEDRIF